MYRPDSERRDYVWRPFKKGTMYTSHILHQIRNAVISNSEVRVFVDAPTQKIIFDAPVETAELLVEVARLLNEVIPGAYARWDRGSEGKDEIKRLRGEYRLGESEFKNRNAMHRVTHEIRKTFLGDYTAGFVSEMMNYAHEETAEGYRWGVRDAEIERAEDDDLI